MEQVGGKLQIKKEPGAEPDKVVVTAIVPAEEATLIPYHKVEDEEGSDCITLGSEDSDVEEIDKTEVKSVLKELTELKRKEAECINHLAEAVSDMRESKVVIITEKIQGKELPRCVYDMYARINNPHNFRAALVAGERLLSIYKYIQVGTDIKKVPELCDYFDVGKMKLYEILNGEKYGKEEEDSKKPLKCITPEPVPVKKDPKMEKEEEEEEPPIKQSKKGNKRSAPKTSTPKKLIPKKAKKTKTTPPPNLSSFKDSPNSILSRTTLSSQREYARIAKIGYKFEG